ncbi:Gamma-glutamylcyclotransferase [Fusarium keratoplasticum]|uniref:Gamma-glutamylcyclotransferase n=1 Tax=Fusarium keratoplasticum TaxID=1328300 RepID=A0ACC0R6E0_9HYPO|nr:Gamma-glutamylcyclotransferase [Fusarium keratoplasticum]KAI8675207.1 Gamma-glutamylcyclotransferase [Fusarium keratoplasticum]
MHGASCLRIIFNSMASHAPVTATAAATNKYYFAYGSNLHLEQMKRRCPGSKLIGSAKLWHYRWQINERGYANVMEADGHWVEGLVFEINQRDESRLDVNEGVSKNAYQKCYMTVMLRRAESSLYRRPVSWIVNNGGPAQARQMAAGQRRSVNHDPHWEQNVLVYISPQYIVDSPPKEEYINRINLGIADARVLGVAEDYISNCIRPFVPATTPKETTAPKTTGAGTTATTPTKPKVVRKVPSPGRKAVKQPVREARRPAGAAAAASKRTPNPSPARSAPGISPARASRPTQAQSQAARRARSQDPPRVVVNTSGRSGPSHRRARSHAYSQPPPLPPRPLSEQVAEYYQETTLRPPTTNRQRATSDVGAPPPLPPRPARRMRSIPVIIVQESHSSSWRR